MKQCNTYIRQYFTSKSWSTKMYFLINEEEGEDALIPLSEQNQDEDDENDNLWQNVPDHHNDNKHHDEHQEQELSGQQE